MIHKYHFQVYFNILEETGISITGLEVEPINFSRVVLKLSRKLTDNQVEIVKNKITQFFKIKFNLISARVELSEIIE